MKETAIAFTNNSYSQQLEEAEIKDWLNKSTD